MFWFLRFCFWGLIATWFPGFGWRESGIRGFGVGWWRLCVQFLGLVLRVVVLFICFGVWLDAGLWACEFVAFGLLVAAWYLGVGLVFDGAVVGCCEFRVWLDWFPVYFGFVELL